MINRRKIERLVFLFFLNLLFPDGKFRLIEVGDFASFIECEVALIDGVFCAFYR